MLHQQENKSFSGSIFSKKEPRFLFLKKTDQKYFCFLAAIAFALTLGAPARADDAFLIVPGKRIGLVTLPATEADFLKAYGDAAQPAEIEQKEGGLLRATILYPCDPARMATIGYDAKTRQVSIVTVPIFGSSPACLLRQHLDPYPDHTDPALKGQNPGDFLDASQYDWQERQEWEHAAIDRAQGTTATLSGKSWHLDNGVRLGMTIAAVQRLNGRPFDLTGPEADLPGGVTDWQGGSLTNCIWAVSFAPPRADSGLGTKYTSDDPILADPHVVVDALFVHAAPERDWQPCKPAPSQ